MRSLAREFWVVGLSFLLGAARAEAQAVPADAGAREWNQARGGPSCDAGADVEPLVSAPVERWRVAFDELVTAPVVWGSKVYVIGRRARDVQLFAFDLADGKSKTSALRVETIDGAYLSAWQGFLALSSAAGIQIFTHSGGRFALSKKRIGGGYGVPPTIWDGTLFAVTDSGMLRVIDLETGTLLTECSTEVTRAGQPVVLPQPEAGHVKVYVPGSIKLEGYEGTFLALSRIAVHGLKQKRVTASQLGRDRHANLDSHERVDATSFASPLVETGAGATGEISWFVFSQLGLKAQNGRSLHGAIFPGKLAPLADAPAIDGANVIGFGDDGALLSIRHDGRFVRVVPPEVPLPAGARRGRITRARGVLYLDNWAVELASGRVLWCVPELDPIDGLLPVGDRMVLYGERGGALVCASDASAAAGATAAVDSTPGPGATKSKGKKTASSAARAPTLPGDGDGVVLASGVRLAGAVTRLEGGRVRVATESADGAAARELELRELALIESGGTVELVGLERAVFDACFAVLAARHATSLLALDDRLLEYGFLDECRRVLDEARRFGLDAGEHATRLKRLDGRRQNQNANAEAQRASVGREERKQREKSAADWLAASEWCTGHELPSTASVLLAWAARVADDPALVRARAKALIPSGFPGPDGADASERWLALSEALLPVAGSVIATDDPVWKRVADTVWSSGALGVRTPNFLWLSREPDAAVIGACLANAERTIATLERLLGLAPPAVRDDTTRLEVRLHRSRDEYLQELADTDRQAMEWSAGYYSPKENVSRFFVMRDQLSDDPLARDLNHVLVHELVHHVVEARWLAGKTASRVQSPGYWIVEGFARFIEDQVVEMERNGERWNDTTVRSLDACARVAREGKLLALDRLIGLDYAGFMSLSDSVSCTVQLRNTLRRIGITERTVFYEQAGSLVYFLANHADAKKRAALIAYLELVYAGKAPKTGWTSLDFEDAAGLQAEFETFLKGL